MKAFRALTLMDTVIAMILAAMVLGMGGTFYLGLVRSIQGYHETSEEVAQYQQLLFLLRHDLDRSNRINANENGFQILNDADQIIASFENGDTCLIRLQGENHKDTFKFQVKEAQYLYKGQLVQSGEMIDQVVLDVSSEKTSQRLEWKKNYSASMRINSDFIGH
jgi:type II secretory pathway component PulJ